SPGQSASYTVTFSSISGFAGTVIPAALNWSNVPGATAAWSPSSITVPSNGSAAATFTIQTAASTTAGTYSNIALQGANGSFTRAASPVSLVVNSAVAPRISISPTTGTLGVTNFTESYSGFTRNGTITENVTYPNGGLTVYHVTADGNGNASASFVLQSQSGNYSSYAVDDGTGTRSNTITYTVNGTAHSSPTISSISPTTPVTGSTDQDVAVYGSNFQPNLTVSVGFPSGGSTTLSGAQIANVTSSSFLMHITLNGAGTWSIRVNNPDGGQSSPFSLSVINANAVPSISLVQLPAGANG